MPPPLPCWRAAYVPCLMAWSMVSHGVSSDVSNVVSNGAFNVVSRGESNGFSGF